jgi:hypothetical protein
MNQGMRLMAVLGLDIGGANLKVAHSEAMARSVPFALWKQPGDLSARLRALLASIPDAPTLAVTMTGELCDCWESKRHGVLAILDAIESVAGTRTVAIWNNQGQFLTLSQSRSDPLSVASANWLATATFAGRYAPTGDALLIDLGTTTTDLVPLREGVPIPMGRTDPQRMEHGELVYLGWKRTPLCALKVPAAAEFFATTHDVMLLADLVEENPLDCDTADGRAATKANARRRIARMWCADPQEIGDAQFETHYGQLVDSLQFAIQQQTRTLMDPALLLAGSGERLTREVIGRMGTGNAPTISLSAQLGEQVSTAACAYAVAQLWRERHG